MVADKTLLKINQTFLDLLASHSWEEVTLPRIAESAGVTLSDLREAFDGKVAMVEYFARRIDADVLNNLDDDVANELPRERLMDVLLSRFDALAEHKEPVRAIMRAARADLSLAAQLNRVSLVSMTWMLNGANIDTSGMEGAVRVQGTTLVFARVLRVWLEDDESMARTMAALDKELRSGERTMRRLDRLSSVLAPFKRLCTRRRARPVNDGVHEEAAL